MLRLVSVLLFGMSLSINNCAFLKKYIFVVLAGFQKTPLSARLSALKHYAGGHHVALGLKRSLSGADASAGASAPGSRLGRKKTPRKHCSASQGPGGRQLRKGSMVNDRKPTRKCMELPPLSLPTNPAPPGSSAAATADPSAAARGRKGSEGRVRTRTRGREMRRRCTYKRSRGASPRRRAWSIRVSVRP
jgi:hypothetical protein